MLSWKTTPLLTSAERAAPTIDAAAPPLTRRGLRLAVCFCRMLARLVGLKLLGRLDNRALGEALAAFCQEMGMLWLKVGQLFSMRSDLFPWEVCGQLARLQDRVTGFPGEVAEAALAASLGRPVAEVFSSFDPKPIAAASIGQVHRAVLRAEGRDVVVKVRRPHVAEMFARDIKTVRILFRVLNSFSALHFLRLADMLWELEHVLGEELDYRFERNNQQRMTRSLAGHGILVPELFPAYCSASVLVMEYVDGLSMTDFIDMDYRDPARLAEWCRENGIRRDRLARKLMQTLFRQLLEDNLFHSDLHPGNLILLRNNRIAFIDFGSVGTTEGDTLRKYFLYLESLATGKFAKAVDLFLLIMPDVPSHNMAAVKEEMLRKLMAWGERCRVKGLSYEEKSATAVTDMICKILVANDVAVHWGLFKILRCWTTLDASIRILAPTSDLSEMMRLYVASRRGRLLTGMGPDLPYLALKVQGLADYLSETAETAIYKGAVVRRLAQVFEGTTSRVDGLLSALFRAGSVVGVGLASLLLLGLWGGSGGTGVPVWSWAQLPHLDPQVRLIAMVVLLHGVFQCHRLARRFSREDEVGPGLT